MTTKIPLLLSQQLLVTAVLGCAAEANLRLPDNEPNMVARASIRQVPMLPTSNSVILGPGENVKIRTSISDQAQYLCSNGTPLLCDRLNRNLYCFCPGSRQPR